MEPVTWDSADQQCIFAGNSQGGPIYEAADGEPNDSLLQGSYTDYITDSAFDYTFAFIIREQQVLICLNVKFNLCSRLIMYRLLIIYMECYANIKTNKD